MLKKIKGHHHIPKVCVSGSAVDISGPESFKKSFRVGEAIAQAGAVLTNGATTGVPFEAARGAKSKGGTVIGFSPAISEKEHVNKYKLPLDYLDVVVYTGSGYAARNLQLTRASDAVIFISGRIGTLNEFTVAFEDKKPMGVLTGSGGIIEELDDIIKVARRGQRNIVFDADPERLVKRVLRIVKARDRLIDRGERKNHANGKQHKTPAHQAGVPE